MLLHHGFRRAELCHLDVGDIHARRDERSETTRTKNTCRELLEVEPAMWTFLTRPEIGMTNNLAERSLRHAVLWRRTSFGSQSESGAETVARLLTVLMTMRSRGESAHRFLLEACESAHAGRAGPPLVPASERQRQTTPAQAFPTAGARTRVTAWAARNETTSDRRFSR